MNVWHWLTNGLHGYIDMFISFNDGRFAKATKEDVARLRIQIKRLSNIADEAENPPSRDDSV